jgi:haloalkane dehalogenase
VWHWQRYQLHDHGIGLVLRKSDTYPFENHFLSLQSGHQLHYLDEGPTSRHAWLMVHGNPTWSYYYRNAALALGEKSRCVVPDHLGCGWSDKPEGFEYSLEKRIDHLEELVQHLELDAITLLLHDWGGAIGMGLAQRLPDKIKGICLLNTAAYLDSTIPFSISICKLPWLGTFIVRALNGFAGPALTMAVKKGKKLEGEVAEMMVAPYDNWANRVAVNAFVKDIPMNPSHPSYSTLSTIEKSLEQFKDHPISIFWGAQDFCFNLHFLERWKAIWPKAKVTLFEDAGHYVLEDAGEEITASLIEFREKQGYERNF